MQGIYTKKEVDEELAKAEDDFQQLKEEELFYKDLIITYEKSLNSKRSEYESLQN